MTNKSSARYAKREKQQQQQWRRHSFDLTNSITTSEAFSIPEEDEEDGDGYVSDQMTVLQISVPLPVNLPPLREIRFEDIDYTVYEKPYMRPTRCFLAKMRNRSSDFDHRESCDWVDFSSSSETLPIDVEEGTTANKEKLNMKGKPMENLGQKGSRLIDSANIEDVEIRGLLEGKFGSMIDIPELLDANSSHSYLADADCGEIGNTHSFLSFSKAESPTSRDFVLKDLELVNFLKQRDLDNFEKDMNLNLKDMETYDWMRFKDRDSAKAADSARDIYTSRERENTDLDFSNSEMHEVIGKCPRECMQCARCLSAIRKWMRDCGSPSPLLSLENCIVQQSVLTSLKAEEKGLRHSLIPEEREDDDDEEYDKRSFIVHEGVADDYIGNSDSSLFSSYLSGYHEYKKFMPNSHNAALYTNKEKDTDEDNSSGYEEEDFKVTLSAVTAGGSGGVASYCKKDSIQKGADNYKGNDGNGGLIVVLTNFFSFVAGIGAASAYHLIVSQMPDGN